MEDIKILTKKLYDDFQNLNNNFENQCKILLIKMVILNGVNQNVI